VPGDTLELEVELVELRGKIGKGHGVARVGQVVVSEGDFTFALVDPPRQDAAAAKVSPA
jgi:3-hydroxyacyl-[acyl-carrier-protein] dehydratase